jgi:two-component system alkaline phosphatase synthesis response regulator PhoP
VSEQLLERCCVQAKKETVTMAQRILVVDDDREIVRLVRAYLEQSGFEVLAALDGETALHILRRERPDLVLLDLMLPGRDGNDVTRIVRGDASLAAMPIIMLTARVEDHDKIVGLELGADDYVTKPFNPGEVVARVRAVLRRVQGEPSPPKVIQVGELSIDLDRHQVQVKGQPVHLTPTEFGLLRALAEHPGHALTRLELIEKGLGYSYEGLERTVDSHIKNLRRKLTQAGAEAGLVETVFGVGYRLAAGCRPQPSSSGEARSSVSHALGVGQTSYLEPRTWSCEP